MINKKSVKHQNIPVQRFFVLFAVTVLSLFFSVNVQAKETKTVYASKLSGDLWDFYYNDDISLNIILDKDCTVDGIWVRFSDWEYDGDVKITGNGHKLIVGNGGISVSNETELVIEDAVIEIDTSEKYSNGSFYDGIYSGSDLTIIRSNIEIHSNAKRMAINTMQLHTDEYAVITGSYYDTYYLIRSDHPIGNVNVSVTEPKAGEKAVFKGSVEDKNIQLTVGTLDDEKIRWYEGTKEYKETDNLTFECGHTYKCVVNLSARLGKVSSVTSVKINGHTAAFAEDHFDYGNNTWHAWFTYEFEVPAAVSDPVPDPAPGAGVAPSSGEAGALTVTEGNGIYTIQGQEAILTAPVSKNIKSITIPAAVKANGKSYPVTGIAPKALAGLKKLSSATIGKNVKAIGTKAFYKSGKLKNLVIKTKKLTKKTIGANAFKGIFKKAVVKTPKAKKNAYKKIFLKKGMKKTMKFK